MADAYKKYAVFTNAATNEALMKEKARQAGDTLTQSDREQLQQTAKESADLLLKLEDAVKADDHARIIQAARELYKWRTRDEVKQ